MNTDKQTKPTDTSDSPLLRPVAKEGANAKASADKTPAANDRHSRLLLRLDCVVILPRIPAGERGRIRRRALQIAELAVAREFSQFQTEIRATANLA